MLTRDELQARVAGGLHFLDGATGSNLQKAGMPRGCCTEKWVLENPDALMDLQRRYVEAGSQIVYAPTFQAQPVALARVGLADETEAVNEKLVAISRQAAGNALVAGDLTTVATFMDSWDPDNFDLLTEEYSRQIRGLIAGGADLLVAETLMYPQEAEAILTAAEMEGAGAVLYSFTMQGDGALLSGMEAGPVLRDLEDSGAAAVGFNCVAADSMTAALVAKLRRYVTCPLICKPNAGIPSIGADGVAVYPMAPAEFAGIMAQCYSMGATLLGGCCGTDPDYIRATRQKIFG